MSTRKSPATKPVAARNGRELARLLELPDEDFVAMELRVALLKKIISEVARQDLTHAKVAELTGTSRSRAAAESVPSSTMRTKRATSSSCRCMFRSCRGVAEAATPIGARSGFRAGCRGLQ